MPDVERPAFRTRAMIVAAVAGSVLSVDVVRVLTVDDPAHDRGALPSASPSQAAGSGRPSGPATSARRPPPSGPSGPASPAPAAPTTSGPGSPSPVPPAAELPPAMLRYQGPLDISGDAEAIARSFRVVSLNPTPLGQQLKDRIKALNPDVVVLAYQDLSSSRSYDVDPRTGADLPDLVTGVGHAEAANEHPEWFAVDRSGARLEWGSKAADGSDVGFPGAWQMAVWDEAYQDRWVRNVVARVVSQGWDGVEADNANPDLAYNRGVALGGGATPASPERGIRQLVAKAGAALSSRGKVLSPNIAEGRFRHASHWWRDLSRWGAGTEERFLQMCDPPTRCFNTDQPGYAAGYDAQALQVRQARLPLMTTSGAWDDTAAFRYGYAGFLIHGAGRGAFSFAISPSGSTPAGGGRPTPLAPDLDRLRPELTWLTGAPVPGAAATADGAIRWRAFEHVFAAENVAPSGAAAVRLPAGRWLDAEGTAFSGRVVLAPQQALVLRRDA